MGYVPTRPKPNVTKHGSPGPALPQKQKGPRTNWVLAIAFLLAVFLFLITLGAFIDYVGGAEEAISIIVSSAVREAGGG